MNRTTLQVLRRHIMGAHKAAVELRTSTANAHVEHVITALQQAQGALLKLTY